jgi:hypothetical protein
LTVIESSVLSAKLIVAVLPSTVIWTLSAVSAIHHQFIGEGSSWSGSNALRLQPVPSSPSRPKINPHETLYDQVPDASAE